MSSPMYLIVGLGNPGSKYTFTRHNIGFLCLDYLLESINVEATPKTEQKSLIWKTKVHSKDVLFVQPQTYMNLSGEAVQSLMAYYKIPLEHLLVIHDDLDLPFLKLRFQKARGSGGHNGVKSVHERMGTDEYARLKLGIGRPKIVGQSPADYALSNFTEEEARQLNELFKRASEGVLSFIEAGYEKTVNIFNQKTKEE